MKKAFKHIYWIVAVALAASFFFGGSAKEKQAAGRAQVIFSELVSAVKAGEVESLTLKDGEVHGKWTEKARASRGHERADFSTRIIPYPRFFEMLEDKKIPTKVESEAGGFSLLRIVDVLGMFLWIGLLFLMFRNMRGGGGLGFGIERGPKIVARTDTNVRFDDVLGIDEAKKEVSEIVDYLEDPAKYERIGAKIPKGVLLVGPPGTGKTMLAKAIASEAGVPFLSISGSDFVEMFVGVGASRVRQLFDVAKKQSPCLVFIDEIDAVGRGRGVGFGNDEREQTLNQLLVEMDGFQPNEGIIIIAATNRADVLDEALLRPGRFDRQVHINLPDIKGREEIVAKYMKGIKAQMAVDPATIARGTPGFSGAELMNLVNEAALIAARMGRKLVSSSDFEYARDKILMGVERKSVSMSPDEVKNTAYHEAGHALLSVLLPGLDPIHKATIIPRGATLGMVQQLPERDKISINITEIKSQIAVSMGGRAAEEIFFGAEKITAGASSDIRNATRLARKSVVEWGFNPKLGNVFYGETAAGFGRTEARVNISDRTAELIDAEVKNMIASGYGLAKSTILKNKAKMIRLAEALLKHETLTGDEVRDIIAGKEVRIAKIGPATARAYEKGRSLPISSAPRTGGKNGG